MGLFSKLFAFSRQRTVKLAHSKVCKKAPRRASLHLEPLENRELLSGFWNALNIASPSGSSGTSNLLLLANGTVMVQGGNQVNTWYELTPDVAGSYINGTWQQMPSMSQARVDFASNFAERRPYSGTGRNGVGYHHYHKR